MLSLIIFKAKYRGGSSNLNNLAVSDIQLINESITQNKIKWMGSYWGMCN
jgi:hypothetical protein